MASSIGAQWALDNQGGLDTYYRNIQNMLHQSGGLTSDLASQYGISAADINAAQSYRPQGTPLSQLANPQTTSALTPVYDTGNQSEAGSPILTGYTSTAPDASGNNVLSTYDQNGKLISNMSQSGGTQSTFDPSGKLLGTQNVGGSGGAFGVIQDLLTSDMVKTLAPMMISANLGAFGGTASPSDIGVSQAQSGLDSSFDQYLSPTGATSYPVAPQTPFSGTSILDPVTGVPTTAATDYSLASQAPVNGMGGAQGIQVNPNANLADMGGGQGITNATSANIADMGGGQGLTTAAAGGGTLGQTGVNTGGSVLGTNPLTGQTLGTALNTLNTGITNPSVSTSGGLPLTNNLTGQALGAGAAAVDTGVNPNNVPTPGGGFLGTGLTAAQVAALGTGVTGLVTGANTNSAISSAQAAQNAAAAKSAGTLSDIYNTQMGSLAPYQATGQTGLTGIDANMPYFQHQFDTADLNSNLAPNYAFQLGQGQQANQRAANVGGGALSGNTLTGLNRYTQDYAGNAYQQAFNNYNTQRNNIYSTLSGIAGIGSTANNSAIGAGNTYGTNLTNLNTGLAAAQAGATVGQAQNTSNTISNLGNAATLAALLGQKNTVGP